MYPGHPEFNNGLQDWRLKLDGQFVKDVPMYSGFLARFCHSDAEGFHVVGFRLVRQIQQ